MMLFAGVGGNLDCVAKSGEEQHDARRENPWGTSCNPIRVASELSVGSVEAPCEVAEGRICVPSNYPTRLQQEMRGFGRLAVAEDLMGV